MCDALIQDRYVVYILENEEHRHYIGMTSDLRKRVEQHNSGVSKWTKNRGPWHVTWVSKTMEHREAGMLEKKMKRQKGGVGLLKLIDDYRSL
jgi:putative endonuclease